MDKKHSWPTLLGAWCRHPWIIPYQIMPGRTLKEYTKAVGKLMLFWVSSVLGAIVLLITDLLGIKMSSTGRGLLWACIVFGLVIFPIFAFRKVMVERDEALNNSDSEYAAGRKRLKTIHDELLILHDCWETGYPAGLEAWRTQVSKLYTEAEGLIEKHYSINDVRAFRQVQASKDDPYFHENNDEVMQRDLLMKAKIGFIYKLLHNQQ